MKKLIMLLVAAVLGMAVQAGAMYWQVSSANNTNVDAEKWTMARVEVYQGGAGTGTYLQIWDGDSWSSGVSYVDKMEEGAWFDVTAYANGSPEYSFVLELVNDNLEIQGTSSAATYSSLADSGVIASSFDSIAPNSYKAWSQGFIDVPEPTRGLMLLLGASLLALRRKQK